MESIQDILPESDESSKVALFACLPKVARGEIIFFVESKIKFPTGYLLGHCFLLLLLLFRRDWGTAKHTVETGGRESVCACLL